MADRANWFATMALLAWPLITLLLYSVYPIGRATIWTILGAYLLLPVGTGIKFDMVPEFDKTSIANLAALIGCIFIAGRMPQLWRGIGWAEMLILTFLFSPFITSALNTDSIAIGAIVLPAVSQYDALSAAANQLITLIPFVLGRQLLRGPGDNHDIIRILAIAGLIYSLPMLLEVRLSPQLHIWLYGYFPHSFEQQMRDGGFRPVVFLGHGLLVAFFGMTAFVAATALWRIRARIGAFPAAAVTMYLGAVLVFCKTLGALLYGLILGPIVRWASPKAQLRVAIFLVTIVLTYPILRTMDIVPTDLALKAASLVDEERMGSLQMRIDQEKLLLDRASERLWFGWGRFGRSRVYDAETGNDISATDGHWIITIGNFGLVGFVAQFGLLVMPVFRAAAALKLVRLWHERTMLAALTLIVAINAFDLIPNASIRPWTWLLAGALLGQTERLLSKRLQRAPAAPFFATGRNI